MMHYLLWLYCWGAVILSAWGKPRAQIYRAAAQKSSGSYIVTIRQDLMQTFNKKSFAEQLQEQLAVTPSGHVRIANFAAVRIKANETTIEKLLDMPEVDFIEEDRVLHGHGGATSTCPNYQVDLNRWGLVRIGSRDKMPTICTGSSCTYSYGSDDNGEGVYVYVIDTGIYLDHSEFSGRAHWGFTASNLNEGNDDRHGHGTHVAGIAIGQNYGVAKAARAIAVKVLDEANSGTHFGAIEGIEWACQDIKNYHRKGVLNLSLGEEGASPALESAIRAALNQEVPVVISAGNENWDACRNTPASLGKDTDAITVAATNIEDQLTSFTNYGDCVNILAPGEKINAADKDFKTGVRQMTGTSMATPFVSGAIARILSNQNISPAGIKGLLLQQATRNVTNLPAGNTPNKMVYSSCHISATPIPTTTRFVPGPPLPSGTEQCHSQVLYNPVLFLTITAIAWPI